MGKSYPQSQAIVIDTPPNTMIQVTSSKSRLSLVVFMLYTLSFLYTNIQNETIKLKLTMMATNLSDVNEELGEKKQQLQQITENCKQFRVELDQGETRFGSDQRRTGSGQRRIEPM